MIRERKFLFRMPLFALPGLALLFWGFGGGQGQTDTGQAVAQGINLSVPGVHLSNEKGWNKGKYYDKAEQDSLDRMERMKNEENYAKRIGLVTDTVSRRKVVSGLASEQLAPRPEQVVVSPEQQVVKIKERLARINKVLTQPPIEKPVVKTMPRQSDGNTDIQKLETIMDGQKRPVKEEDTEITQLSGVLDKLIEAEHPLQERDYPTRGKDSIRMIVRPSVQRDVLSVEPVADSSLEEGSTAIDALIPEEQALVSGAELRLELGRDLMVGGECIPRGTPLYGMANLSGERLQVTIRSLCVQERVFPVSLQVYDEDGQPGIYIPGVPANDAVRESANQDVGSLGAENFSPTLAGQAASAGIQLGRTLIAKKIRPVRVTIPADYRLILKDNKIFTK